MATEHWSENIWITKLSDEPLLSEDLQGLIFDIDNHSEQLSLVIDLSQVNMIQSMNLSLLIQIQDRTRSGGGRVILACPTNTIWAVFLATNLDKIFSFSENIPEALTELQIG